jgi:hypothetical protein
MRTADHEAGNVAGGITTPVRIHRYSVIPQVGGVLAHPLVGATELEVDFAYSCTEYCPSFVTLIVICPLATIMLLF